MTRYDLAEYDRVRSGKIWQDLTRYDLARYDEVRFGKIMQD